MKLNALVTVVTLILLGLFLGCGGNGSNNAPVDADQDGFTLAQGDCDDGDPLSYPGADEVCNDGIDQDCDGRDFVCDEPLDEIVPRDAAIRPFEKKRFVALTRQVEFLQLGASYSHTSEDPNNLFVIDPLEFNHLPDGSLPDISPDADDLLASLSNAHFSTTYQKTASAGSMDDDIQEEVAVVCWGALGAGSLLIVNPEGAPTSSAFTIEPVAVDLAIDARDDLAYAYDITSGDIDGDGYDEIVIAGVLDGATPAERQGRVWVVDDAKAGHGLIDTLRVAGPVRAGAGHLGMDALKVAAGDIDADWADEIAIAFTAVSDLDNHESDRIYYRVFDDAVADFVILRDDHTQMEIYPLDVMGDDHTVNITMGDMDRDGRDEIAVAIRSYYLETLTIEVFDDAVGADGYTDAEDGDSGDAIALMGSQSYPLDYTDGSDLKFFDGVDIDGDRADEILLGHLLLDDVRPSNSSPLGMLSDYEQGHVRIDNSAVHTIAFGDVNGDRREDIIILYYDAIIETIGYEEVAGDDPNELLLFWRGGRTDLRYGWGSERYLDRRGTHQTGIGHTILVAANVDDDSTVIEYGGDNPDATPIEVQEAHSTYYGRNHILAVLAAPPSIDGINSADSSTSFGQSTSNSFGAGAEVSVRGGILIGGEVSVSSGLFVNVEAAKCERELELALEVTVTGSTKVSASKMISYSTGENEDRVIFSAIPYDRYEYTIAAHPDPDKVGKGFSIDYPQTPKILSWSRDYYNAHNGDQLDIGSEILAHTPGDIGTYPSKVEKDEILSKSQDPAPDTVPLIDDGLWWLLSQVTSLCEHGPVRVQEGRGAIDLEIELTNEQTVGGGLTGSVDYMQKDCGGGICAGFTVGVSVGASFESTWSEGTSFAGSVGGIEGDLWDQHNYDYGMFSYRQTLVDEDSNKAYTFIVLNYWVE